MKTPVSVLWLCKAFILYAIAIKPILKQYSGGLCTVSYYVPAANTHTHAVCPAAAHAAHTQHTHTQTKLLHYFVVCRSRGESY